MRHIRPVDFEVRRPFRYADAVAAGISPSSLRGANFRRLFTGAYVHASVEPHPLMLVRAALVIHPPTAFASHLSAARVYGLPVPARPDEHVSVFEEKDRRRRTGIRNHVAAADIPVTVVRGIRVSVPCQTFVELADLLDLVDLVVVGDYLVAQQMTTVEQLRRFCWQSNHRGAVAARRAAEYVRAEVDSPMETRLRMLIVLAGLPEPVINFKILDERGRVRYRFDLSYPELKLAVEYDGRQHRADLDQWDHDTERRDWLDHHGWMLVPVFSRGIFQSPDKTLTRVLAALKQRGHVRLPRVLHEDWRRHFPVRN